MPTDHYVTLGVRPGAPPAEIRAAYLRLMRTTHPDLRPGDPVAADTARRVNAAYHVLGNASRRHRYDHARAARPGPAVTGARPPDRAEALRAAAKARRAYSQDQRGYRQAFSRACLRVGVAIVVLGTGVLLVLG